MPILTIFPLVPPVQIRDRQTIFARFALADMLICLGCIGDCGIESELLFLGRQQRKYCITLQNLEYKACTVAPRWYSYWSHPDIYFSRFIHNGYQGSFLQVCYQA